MWMLKSENYIETEGVVLLFPLKDNLETGGQMRIFNWSDIST